MIIIHQIRKKILSLVVYIIWLKAHERIKSIRKTLYICLYKYFDFFSLKNNSGFRQKVMPQLDGTYLTNDIKEDIKVSNKDGVFYINYTTTYGKWNEEILEIQDSVLVLKNKDNLEYHYKRQVPFSIK